MKKKADANQQVAIPKEGNDGQNGTSNEPNKSKANPGNWKTEPAVAGSLSASSGKGSGYCPPVDEEVEEVPFGLSCGNWGAFNR